MTRIVSCSITALAVCTCAATTVAAPPQDRPGIPTQARVWIQNRESNEAIPVRVQDGARIQVAGPVALDRDARVEARRARQPWEYRTVVLSPDQTTLGPLAGLGIEGWEATGVQIAAPDGVTILLKRPL